MAGFASGSSEQKLTKKILLERNVNLNSVAEGLVEELETIQRVIDTLDEDVSEKKARVLMSYETRKKPIFDRRNDLAKNIPHFWIKSFEKHPEVRSLIDRETGDCLRYLNRLEVYCTDSKPPRFVYRLNFHFDENPYFENDVLSKEIVFGEDDTITSTNTEITWKPEKKVRGKTYNLASPGRKRKWEPCTFFEWFESSHENDTFVDCFRDLHQHPLQYFYRSHGDDCESYREGDGEMDFTDDTEDEDSVM